MKTTPGIPQQAFCSMSLILELPEENAFKEKRQVLLPLTSSPTGEHRAGLAPILLGK